jgi:hypothetical protein
MPIITLTSDWGLKDHFLAAVKGSIYKHFPGAIIVDISHEIASFDLNQAAFIVRNSWRNFPEGTVHILGMNTEASIATPHMVIFYGGHYFIGADTGIFSLILDDLPEKIIELDIIQDSDYFTFSTRDVFVKAACHIAKGNPPEELGKLRNAIVQKIPFRPVIDGNLIKGKVIYVDRYENAYTNITETLFTSMTRGKKFIIQFRSDAYKIKKISKSYKDVVQGEMLALFSTTGLLEIAINQGKASSLLGLKVDQSILIEII